MFFDFISQLHLADYIQIAILVAIVWYSYETFKLRKWQQKNVQISILDLQQRIHMHKDENFHKGVQTNQNIGNKEIINMMNDILEHGKFNLRKIYVQGFIQEDSKKNFLIRFLKWFKK